MIQRFEELIAWKKARRLTSEVYRATRLPLFRQDYGLCRQVQRAAVSVMSNIAEGFERRNRREFRQFLFVAKASCAEVRSQLYVAFDVGYLEESQLNDLLDQAEEVARVIGGLCASLERSTPRPR